MREMQVVDLLVSYGKLLMPIISSIYICSRGYSIYRIFTGHPNVKITIMLPLRRKILRLNSLEVLSISTLISSNSR